MHIIVVVFMMLLRPLWLIQSVMSCTQRFRSAAGQNFGISDYVRSHLLNLDVRPPSHRQWSELQQSPSAQHPYELANQLQKP